MPLSDGARSGPDEILAPITARMGEAHRAKGAKLIAKLEPADNRLVQVSAAALPRMLRDIPGKEVGGEIGIL